MAYFCIVTLLKNLIFLIFAAFTFVGSVGMGVFTHFCHKDGIEQSYILPPANHCADKKTEVQICCVHEVQIQESDCCSDQVDFFQLDFEQFESPYFFSFYTEAFSSGAYFSFRFVPASSELVASNYANPPPILSGRQILIQNQVFRI